jgi:phosphatidylglycerol lysyltransferase
MSILPALLQLVLADGLRRGLTLGGLDELADEQVRCLVAIDTDRTVHGITSWLPMYTDGKITGWTLDFMRRRASGFRGVVEFLIASATVRFQEKARSCSACPGRRP